MNFKKEIINIIIVFIGIISICILMIPSFDIIGDSILGDNLPSEFSIKMKRQYFPTIEKYQNLFAMNDYRLIRDEIILTLSQNNSSKNAFKHILETKYVSHFKSEFLQEIKIYNGTINKMVRQRISLSENSKQIISCPSDYFNFTLDTWIPLNNSIFNAKKIQPYELLKFKLISQKVSSEYSYFINKKLISLSNECLNDDMFLWMILIDQNRMVICAKEAISWIFYKNYIGFVSEFIAKDINSFIFEEEKISCPFGDFVLKEETKMIAPTGLQN